MALRDAAIVGYAETKIVEKSGRDVWELGAEILETLLGKTKFEKGEIDGLILSSSMTGAGNCFLNGARSQARARSFPTRSPVARVPPFQGHEPFLIGLVTLDEGVNVMANIVHCGLEKIRIGLRVKPFWLPLANGTHLLMFEPD